MAATTMINTRVPVYDPYKDDMLLREHEENELNFGGKGAERRAARKDKKAQDKLDRIAARGAARAGVAAAGGGTVGLGAALGGIAKSVFGGGGGSEDPGAVADPSATDSTAAKKGISPMIIMVIVIVIIIIILLVLKGKKKA